MLCFLVTMRLFPPEVMPFELVIPAADALTSSIDVIALRRSPVLDWKMLICTDPTGLTPR